VIQSEQSQSNFATDGLSVSRSVSQSVFALSSSETHDQILTVVKTVAVLFVMGRLPCREDGSIRSQSLVLVCVKEYMYIHFVF
jgi:hypothetical protein